MPPKGTITSSRRFSPILPSAPIVLPFEGDYKGLAVVVDLDRVMGLPEHIEDIAGEIIEQVSALRKESNKLRRAFTETWGSADAVAPENIEAYREAQDVHVRDINHMNNLARRLDRRYNLAVVADTVIGIGIPLVTHTDAGEEVHTLEWPFKDDNQPDPKDAESWNNWSDLVLNWLATNAQRRAAEQLRDPKSDGR